MSYRKGVAIIIVSSDRKNILLGERSNQKNQWQIPQGGMEPGEEIIQSLKRELLEEVGIELPEILSQTHKFISYEWPKDLFPNSRFKGQTHIYFLLDGSNIQIDSLLPSEEFSNFKWFEISTAIELSIGWKRKALSAAIAELKLINGAHSNGLI